VRTALERARGLDEQAFGELAEAHGPELRVHCYRIVGSVQDAEDLVQETLLAAWRSRESFEGRASVRSWLYRIATNRCLNALRDRRARLPQLPPQPSPRSPEPSRQGAPLRLEPYPDALLEGVDPSDAPDRRYEDRETIGLAFVTALQHLPPRQRAVLALRDVLGFRAAEVADMLDTSEASVNSALHRARSTLDRRLTPGHRELAALPRSAKEREVVGRFTEAWESGDVGGIVALLSDDALLTMPPEGIEYHGPQEIGKFLSTVPAAGELERFRLVPTRANGQPAFGCYLRDLDTPTAHAYLVMVLTLREDRVAAITGFTDTSVFAPFELPVTIPNP
jgi:RNA polymerase sigma-70 factor (TIGR02960 family)